MAGEGDIAEDIRRIIRESIHSVTHMEAILLLRGNPGEVWSVDTVARRLYVTPAEAASVLADLREDGILAAEEDGNRYAYRPQSPALNDLIGRLADTYRERLIAITNLIHSTKPRRNARRFSDAFRLRREE